MVCSITIKKQNNMKKVKFESKLGLNKETIAKLNDEQMMSVNGGDTRVSMLSPCYSISTCAGNCPSGPTACTGAISGCAVCNQ